MHRHGKTFVLRLAADVIRGFDMVRDKDGGSFARKAMLQCGLCGATSETRIASCQKRAI